MSSRFGNSTEAERAEGRANNHAAKTLKANKSAAKTFKEYLCSIGENSEFETFEPAQLDDALGKFYMDIRRVDGTLYKTTSMESVRYGINRYLRGPPHFKPFDITRDAVFVKSNGHFKGVLRELKRDGKGDVDHYPIIPDEEIQKLYKSVYLDITTPQGLFNKVQFDIRLYFSRRGNKNMYTMGKSTFKVEKDSSGIKVVKRAEGELTKNHRTDKENQSGFMPENPGSMYCPVVSFEKYLSKLHPECNRLWQRPKESFLPEDDTWYCNGPVGEKKLKKFMTGLSKAVGLSRMFTNHSVRATGATILSKSKFNPAQVMSVTGHKSDPSLTLYQRVGDSERVQMDQAIAHSITQREESRSSILNDIWLNNELEGINCDDLFSDFDAPELQQPVNQSACSSGPVFKKFMRRQTRQERGKPQICPELAAIIHDQVITLCQAQYSSFEVDGLICITLLDTKEQQVIKIHKTLKQVAAVSTKSSLITKTKNNSYPSITAILSSAGNSVKDNATETCPAENPSYQNDINRLSDILKETNSLSRQENDDDQAHVKEFQQTKRKRKKPKQIVDNVEEDTAAINGYDRYTDNIITVKEELPDSEYGVSKVVSNAAEVGQDVRMSVEPGNELAMPVDNECLNDEGANSSAEVHMDSPTGIRPSTSSTNTNPGANNDNDDEVFAQFLAGQNEQGNVPDGTNQKHSEWLYQLAKKSLQDSGNNSGSDSGSSDNVQSTVIKGFVLPRERGRQEPDPHGRSWFEMIKSNASKYQAALVRSGKKGMPNTSFEQLKSLLNVKKAGKGTTKDKDGQDAVNRTEEVTDINRSNENGKTKEHSADDAQESEKSLSRSISPVPIVKIEVDEQPAINFDQSSNEASGTEHDTPANSTTVADPKYQGKLVSRYPALFNQLQTKRDATPSVEQSDSLLNRLPFISFQELFSPSGESVPNVAPTAAEAPKQTFLEKALKDDPPKSKDNKKLRTVWNWKKRRVRPKDEHGNIIDYLPAGASVPLSLTTASRSSSKKKHRPDDEEEDAEWTPSSGKKAKFKASIGRAGSRLSTRLSTADRPKTDFAGLDVSDQEEDCEDLDDIKGEGSKAVANEIQFVSAYCRYQCGRRFETFGDLAEHEPMCDSKIFSSVEICGKNDQTKEEIQADVVSHAEPIDQSVGSGHVEGDSYAEMRAEDESDCQPEKSGQAEGSGQVCGGHKCSICGLDFNQQYRWQYHMVKVHGVTVTTDPLFR